MQIPFFFVGRRKFTGRREMNIPVYHPDPAGAARALPAASRVQPDTGFMRGAQYGGINRHLHTFSFGIKSNFVISHYRHAPRRRARTPGRSIRKGF